MKAWIFARRELRENRLVWAGAAFAAVVGRALPWAKGLRGENEVLAAALALHLGCVLAVAGFLAFRGVPGDLGERRLGFDLAQPAGLGALLGGRLLGDWLLAVGSGALVLVPVLATGVLPWGKGLGLMAFTGALAVPTLLAAHLLGVAWRARSLWILLDLGLATFLVWSLDALLTAFAQEAPGGLDLLLGLTPLVLVPVLLLAVILPLARGLTDLARVRRYQTLILAPGLLLLPALGFLLLAWSRAGGPASIRQPLRKNAPAGAWSIVVGPGRLQRPLGFLVNGATGFHTEAPGGPCAFSGDGRHLLVVRPAGEDLEIVDLALGDRILGSAVRMRLPRRGASLGLGAVSQDARRALLILGRTLVVLDLEAGRILREDKGERDFFLARYVFLPDGSLQETLPPAKGGTRILDPGTGAWREAAGSQVPVPR